MKLLLKIVSAAIFIAMTVVTVRTSLTVSLWDAWDAYAANPWAVATLWDAYCGFTIFWLWVAFRERSWAVKIAWLILVYALGNIATSAYVFLALIRLKPEEPVGALFARRAA
jgi:hypothetical protein